MTFTSPHPQIFVSVKFLFSRIFFLSVYCTYNTVHYDKMGKLYIKTFLRVCSEPWVLTLPQCQCSWANSNLHQQFNAAKAKFLSLATIHRSWVFCTLFTGKQWSTPKKIGFFIMIVPWTECWNIKKFKTVWKKKINVLRTHSGCSISLKKRSGKSSEVFSFKKGNPVILPPWHRWVRPGQTRQSLL